MATRSAPEIARETLKRLASQRLQPTPENYQAIYDEISGRTSEPAFPTQRMRQIMRAIPGQTQTQNHLLEQMGAAVQTKDWTALQNVLIGYANLGLSPIGTTTATPTSTEHVPKTLAEHIARLVDALLPTLGEDDARVRQLATELTQWLRQPAPQLANTEKLLGNFAYRLSFTAEEQAAIRLNLLALLQMVFDNITVLSEDDRWLHGQAMALRDATTPPLTLRRLDEVQHRLKDVIARQSEARERSIEVQNQMRELLATFIDRLAQIDESSTAYHDQLSDCAERISQVKDITELSPLLEEVMRTTRAMAQSSRTMRTELHGLRQRVDASHAEIEHLRRELERSSAQARHDPLTGSLNRKGLDEVLKSETARVTRSGGPMCIALLDLDNFKVLNDRYGHAAGDAALIHLVETVRQTMRPQDQLARYGGEEFILVLPDTALEQGVEAMKRLQRELTKHYFMQNDEHVLITFSAGVAQLEDGEDSATALQRADQAMYLAKRAGKNQVVAG